MPATQPLTHLNGLPVMVNQLATQLVVRHEIRLRNQRARRKRWRVVRIEERRPSAYAMLHPVTGRKVLVVHPEVLRQFSASTPTTSSTA